MHSLCQLTKASSFIISFLHGLTLSPSLLPLLTPNPTQNKMVKNTAAAPAAPVAAPPAAAAAPAKTATSGAASSKKVTEGVNAKLALVTKSGEWAFSLFGYLASFKANMQT